MIRNSTLAVAVAMLMLADLSQAAPPRPVRRTVSVPAAASTAVNPGTLAQLRFSDVMFMTDKDGRHFWQVRIDNTSSNPAANVVVPAWLHGFMPRSEQPCHAVPVAAIAPGATAYARGPLPLFEGAHLLKIKTQGQFLDVELPRPYRRDANGTPSSAQVIDEFTVTERQGVIHFTMKTNVNVYEPIAKGDMVLTACVRLRKTTKDDPLWAVVAFAGRHELTRVVPTGDRWIVTGTIDVGPEAPSRLFDRVGVRLGRSGGSARKTLPVAESHWRGCAPLTTPSSIGIMEAQMP